MSIAGQTQGISLDSRSVPYVIYLYWALLTSILGQVQREVQTIKLKPREILSEIRTHPGADPIRFKNHTTSGVIEEVALVGLHRQETHISITEIKLTEQQNSEFYYKVSRAKGIKITIPGINKPEVTGAVVSLNCDTLCTVLKEVLLHMQVFYWRSEFIELHLELLEDYAGNVGQPSNVDDLYPAFPHVIITPRPLVMAAVPDDDRILHNQPSGPLVCLSSGARQFYALHGHCCDQDRGSGPVQNTPMEVDGK